MPRKITITDLKNKRDVSAWKIELNGYGMSDTNAKHEAAVKELAKREEKRINELKDTLWEAAVQFFGINISPEKLKEKFESIMNAECNMDAVLALLSEEEERVRKLEAEDAVRIVALKASHTKLVADLEKAKAKNEKKSEDSADSDREVVMEEPSESEINNSTT